jgi:hypothetical protein
VSRDDLSELPAREAAQIATDRLMKEIYRLFGEIGGQL